MLRNIFSLIVKLIALGMICANTSGAYAASKPEKGGYSWFAETGMGYDSNAFQAPRNTYVDYASIPLGSNPTIVPRSRSGMFIPYRAKIEATKPHEKLGTLVGAATMEGRFYTGGLNAADEFNLAARGGSTFSLGNAGSKRKAYLGAVFERHQQVYVDHDSGASKTTVGGSDISERYSYSSFGAEAEYKNELDLIDYSFKARYLMSDYSDPVVVSQMDNTSISINAELDYLVYEGTKLNFSAGHSQIDYSDRHARNASGVYSSTANPLLKYTYNNLGITLRSRVSQRWLYYVDYDYSQRTDGYVNYNDYKLHRIGGRLIYEQGALKGRVSLHHWKRDYPHAFAYDVAGQAAKTYSGNDLRVKAEFAQTRQLSFWAEALLYTQDSSDLRYAYDRKQIMAGARWDM